MEILLAALVVWLSVLVGPWIARVGDNAYQEFLRTQWILVGGGKGLQLDAGSLPLPPLLYLTASAIVGPNAAERWLPIALSIGILLVLTRVLLRDYPLPAKLFAVAPLVASPFFYTLQANLNFEVYVLLLGLQLSTLRSFQLRPTVARVTVAVGFNILLSLTTYTALIALFAAIGYLLAMSNRQGRVETAAWRAMLWLYVPFSFSGYLVWALFWMFAGSRIKTNYFLPSPSGGASVSQQLVDAIGNQLLLPLLLLLGIAIVLRLLALRPAMRPVGWSQALPMAIGAYMIAALGLLILQLLFQGFPLLLLPQEIAFSLILLVPAAMGTVYTSGLTVLRHASTQLRLSVLVTTVAIMAIFALQYLVKPALFIGSLSNLQSGVLAQQRAASMFRRGDPGGRVLLDPRFTASFVLAAHIDPHRLLTPFDGDFPRWVANPPHDVRAIVVTDSRDDLVGDNYPALRLGVTTPYAVLMGEGMDETTVVRVFHRVSVSLPMADVARPRIEPYARAEDRLLAEVEHRLGSRMLPTRLDGWAYGIDEGNLLIYAAESGDVNLFRRIDAAIRRYYLVTRVADRNALYSVAWRARPGHAPEATGTTEELRVIEGYLDAAEGWHLPDLVRLAHVIARTYLAHQQPASSYNRWFIRNYYNYETKQYATNTFTVDYNPSVIFRLAQQTGDAEVRRVAAASRAFLHAAQQPSGLFYEMYQPEVQSIYPEVTMFSPNSLVKTYDAAEVALELADNDRRDAEKTLAFLRRNYGHLYAEYVATNMSTQTSLPSMAVYAGASRLATALGDLTFARRIVNGQVLSGLGRFLGAPDRGSWYFDAITTLLALREIQQETAKTTSTIVPSSATNAPAVLLNPTTLSLGQGTGLNLRGMQTVHLINLGPGSLEVGRVAGLGRDQGDFAIADACSGRKIRVYEGCIIRIGSIASTTAIHRATLVITDNGAGDPHRVALVSR